jgi:hypothetical protein
MRLWILETLTLTTHTKKKIILTMSKDICPADENGDMLVIGSYVKYADQTWEIIDYEDSEQPYFDDNYTEHSTLLLSPRSHEGEDIWVEDYDVLQTEYQQLYFEL